MRAVPFLLSATLVGCHAKYRKHLDDLDVVAPVLQVNGAPVVSLGLDSPADEGESVARALVDVAASVGAAVTGASLEQRLQGLVKKEKVEARFLDGLLGASAGLPYRLEEGGSDSLRIFVESYGIDVSGGTPRVFMQGRVRIYDEGRDRVYKARLSCASPLGGSHWALDLVAEGAGALAAVQQLQQLPDKKLKKMVDEAFEDCGAQLADQLQRHAG